MHDHDLRSMRVSLIVKSMVVLYMMHCDESDESRLGYHNPRAANSSGSINFENV